jgi:primosomal protein N' (replication factor Y)
MTIELHIAVPSPLHQTFSYTHIEPLAPGTRVVVPFGQQVRTVGVVLAERIEAPGAQLSNKNFELKAVREVLDKDPIYSPVLLRLAQWLAHYYMYPIGEVLRTMLPASKKKTVKTNYELNTAAELNVSTDDLQPNQLFGRKLTMSRTSLVHKLREQTGDAKEAETILKKWLRKKWISVATDRGIKARTAEGSEAGTLPLASVSCINEALFKDLNPRQSTAVQTILNDGLALKDLTTRKPFLLFGVTGSGKTEVFLHVIRSAILNAEISTGVKSQTLILVPEISLTPQMTRIFEERFPGLVAVVHSAMDDHERWRELDRIRRGEALILIGPRSTVFGPFANLKLIIVDEEHDSSYKQGDRLLYNARDVAIVRAGMENATIILGSATPSMESWQNANAGKYRLIEMPERASTKPLPNVEILPGKPAFKALSYIQGNQNEPVGAHESPFMDEVVTALKQNFENGQQSIVLVNRRGYAYYLISLEDKKAAGCPHCSINLSVHGRKKILRCHYCDYTTTIQKVIADSPEKTWAVVGYGSQKAEECLHQLIPGARISRLDSDTIQDPKALPEILNKFRDGAIDILVGTQILAKGHDFPNVTLIAILEVDQLLGLPDFRGGERTFQLLVQAAGRSGRGSLPGRVIVQSLRAQHPVVQAALKHDYLTFAKLELSFRQAMGYPPFGRLILFEFNSSDGRKLDQWCDSLETKLTSYMEQSPELLKSVRVLGPAPAPIEIIRGRIRRTIMILSPSLQNCRHVAARLASMCAKPPADVRVKIDVDPQSTL